MKRHNHWYKHLVVVVELLGLHLGYGHKHRRQVLAFQNKVLTFDNIVEGLDTEIACRPSIDGRELDVAAPYCWHCFHYY